jgi:hypothetical protein
MTAHFLNVTQYRPRHSILQNLVKYFWVFQSEQPISIHNKLLPVNNIDIVVNLSAPIQYVSTCETEITPRSVHFNGAMIQHWERIEDLKVVVKLMMKEPITEEFRQALDPVTVKMQFFQKIETWNGEN